MSTSHEFKEGYFSNDNPISLLTCHWWQSCNIEMPYLDFACHTRHAVLWLAYQINLLIPISRISSFMSTYWRHVHLWLVSSQPMGLNQVFNLYIVAYFFFINDMYICLSHFIIFCLLLHIPWFSSLCQELWVQLVSMVMDHLLTADPVEGKCLEARHG